MIPSCRISAENLPLLNRKAFDTGAPFVLFQVTEASLWLGPLIVPGRTGCWECLAQRLRFNLPIDTYLRDASGEHVFPVGWQADGDSDLEKLAEQIVSHEIAKWQATGESILEGALITFDAQSIRAQKHRLIRRPQCPICGNRSGMFDFGDGRKAHPLHHPQPLELHSRKKTFTADGGHRTVPPEETFAAYVHHLSPLTGVVRHLVRTSDPDDPLIHSYAAVHTNTSTFEGTSIIHKNRMVISGGKGRSDIQARVSALCEGIERTSCIYRGEEFTRTATMTELGDEAIHPNACLRISERQYHNRAALNEINERGQHLKLLARWIPDPFEEDARIEWSSVWSITEQRFKYLPTAYCYFGYPPDRSPYCRADSNGCAAGNTIEEAILQGSLELVERDAVAIWWYNRLQVPGVDLDSFDEPYFRQLEAYHARVGRELWVLDLTSDLEIPAFAALSRRVDRPREDILLGFGAHFDARLAVQRALTELNQVLPVALRVQDDADGTPQHPDRLAVRWWMEATLANQPYLAPCAGARQTASDLRWDATADLLDDIRTCAAAVESKGMELLVLDLTRPDVGMPVVKVIVPGLRHYWPRLGPGRLYDVPVEIGLRSAPTAEEDVNPFPIFF